MIDDSVSGYTNSASSSTCPAIQTNPANLLREKCPCWQNRYYLLLIDEMSCKIVKNVTVTGIYAVSATYSTSILDRPVRIGQLELWGCPFSQPRLHVSESTLLDGADSWIKSAI